MSDELDNSQENCEALNGMLAVSVQEDGRDGSADLSMMLTDNFNVRKNLGGTFDAATVVQSVTVNSTSTVVPAQDPSSQSVASKIAHLEAVSRTLASSDDITSNEETPSSGLRVYLRLRPVDEPSTIQIVSQKQTRANTNGQITIRTRPPSNSNAFKVSRTAAGTERNVVLVKEYDFSSVFEETASQLSVYQQTVQPYVQGVISGQSALVFCYGITNAGKSYTMMGPEKAIQPQNRKNAGDTDITTTWGLMPRAVQDLLNLCQSRYNKNLVIQMSYYEIYNERVYDLLPSSKETSLTVKPPTAQGTTTFKGLSSYRISNLSEGLSFIAQARRNRRSATNRINRDSSRSHAICQLRVIQQHIPGQPFSDLWLVDLAGSERAKRTGGARQHEASTINRSLMTLNRCLTNLSASQELGSKKQHPSVMIPWRESKLTRLFAAHWMGPYAARTCMIVNVHPGAADFDETQHVLSYAAVARTLQLKHEPVPPATTHVEYGYDGRCKYPPAKKGVVRKVAQVMRKLSPTRALDARKRRLALMKSNDEEDAASSKPAAKKMRVHKKPPAAERSTAMSSVFANAATADESGSKEVTSLKMALSVAQAEVAILRSSKHELEEKVEYIEAEVRNEVAEEMETQMHTMRLQYEAMIDSLKSRLRLTESKTQESTDHQSQMENAEQNIDSMFNQVVMCEEEMKRMQAEHAEELKSLRRELAVERERNQTEPAAVEENQLKLCSQHEDHDQHSSAGNTESDGSESDDVNEESDEEDESPEVETRRMTHVRQHWSTESQNSQSSGDADERSDEDGGPERQLRRTTRSQVRKQSATKSNPFLSSIGSARKPLGSLSNVAEASDDSFGPEAWLKPRKELKTDPNTGTFLRPRGRKPKNADAWDEHRGAWRLSIIP